MVCDAADDAPWRTQRLGTSEFLQREWERGKKVCPIFSVFGMVVHIFKVDWLHCADQGVASDFLGNLFDYVVDNKMAGSSKQVRCKALDSKVKTFYRDHGVKDQLKGIFPGTYQAEKKSKQPPKLKGSAATTRALVPFGNQLAQELLLDGVPLEHAMKTAAHHLNNCYNSLHESSKPFSHDALYQSSKVFAIQFQALFNAFGDGRRWRPMPKMHLFLELCSTYSEPEKFWNYRDEDFGGTIARQSRMKGRWKKLSAYCKHGLDLFKMKNKAARVVD